MRTRIGASMLSLVLAVGFLVAIPAGFAAAATTVLNATDTGDWSSEGQHTKADSDYEVGNTPLWNNYFTFDLGSVPPCPGTITAARLSAPNRSGYGVVSTYTLYDVSTSAADLDTDAPAGSLTGKAVHADLESGIVFGSVLPATMSETPIDVQFNASGIAALNAARGGKFSVGGDLTDGGPGNYMFAHTSAQVVSLTLTIDPTPVYRPDAQIKGGLASAYLGDTIHNQSGSGQTFVRQARPGFGDQFNVKVQNDSNCFTDSFTVHGAGSSTKFKVTYWSGATSVTPAVVAGTFQTASLTPGGSQVLTVFIYARPGTKSGTWMNDRVSVTSDADPAISDVVVARLVVNKKAGDFNSQLPIP